MIYNIVLLCHYMAVMNNMPSIFQVPTGRCFFFKFSLKKTLFVYLLFSSAFFLQALEPGKAVTQYHIQAWNMARGLPDNTVYAITQTRDGFLWIGTQDGLARFDGVDFKLYSSRNIPQLNCNEIRALYEDSRGALWIGTNSGGLTRFRQGEFFTYANTRAGACPQPKRVSEMTSSFSENLRKKTRFSPISSTGNGALNAIRAINEDRGGSLWVGSGTSGLTCLTGGAFTTYTKADGLPDNRVKFIHKDETGHLWVTTAAGIVKIIAPGIFQVYAPPEELPHFKNVCLHLTDTGETWIGTGGEGLFRLKKGKYTNYGRAEGTPHHIINYLYRDKSQNLWIGTDGGGLTRMRDGKFATLRDGDGLTGSYIYSIYEDREGSLWVGTVDGGLHQLRDGKFSNFTVHEGLVHDYIQCIHQSSDSSLWIGGKGGLNRLQDGRVTATLTTKQGLLHNSVRALYEDRTGSLWIGTWGGLQRLKDGGLSALTDKEGLSDNRIQCILGDSRGSTWVGTFRGLNRFDGSSGKITTFTTRQGLAGNNITFIFEKDPGALLVGTEGGLNLVKGNIISSYTPDAIFKGKNIYCACRDKEGRLWFGSDRGLILRRDKETVLFTLRHGLNDNYIYSIIEENTGYLWLGGRNGLSRIAKKELAAFAAGKIQRLSPLFYNEKDGLKSGWCNGPGLKTENGGIWFPTSIGAVRIDPTFPASTGPPRRTFFPQPVLEKLEVDGEHVGPLSAGDTLRLAPGKKRLEFYYTAAGFIEPHKIKFRVKLSGCDSEWLDRENLRSATYTGLSPGNYTFRVQACSSRGEWNGQAASLSFYLAPRFTQTPWFYLFSGLSIGMLGFFFYRSRIKQIRARERELRLKELDKIKSRFFANISHEFRTPLTLIMGPLEQMLSGPREGEKKEKQQLRLMLRSSHRLLGLINQLLDLSRLDSGKMKLQAAKQNIAPFLKGIVESFHSLAEQKEIELNFETAAAEIILYYDADKIEKVISNLLFNAVKFTPPGGQVTVTVREKKDPPPAGIEISVKDTGIGIPAASLEHIFDRFYQAPGEITHKGTGIGLALAKELTELHHGRISAGSREGEGSEFIILLPTGKKHLKPADILSEPPGEAPRTAFPSRSKAYAGTAEAAAEEEAVQEEAGEFDPRLSRKEEEKDIILVIEDNADVRQYIKGPLLPIYRVEEAADGEEGIDKAREIVPDLILCDVMMPGIDGIEVCRQVKNDRITSHIPVILLTAKAGEENIIQGLETGADDYVTKPFNTRILLARIKNLIDLRRHMQQCMKRQMTLQPAEIAVSEVDREFLKELQAAIDKKIDEPEFNVDELCEKLYMGRTTLYRKLNALSGETPKEFIRSYRLKRAAELLKRKAGSVLDVSFQVGFSSSSYFAKCFKEKFHQSPSEYQVSAGE